MDQAAFSETQRFTQVWAWIILITSIIITIVFLVRFIRTERAKNINPIIYLIFLLPLGFGILFFTMKLETHIDENGISYRFFPFRMKESKIDWDSVEKVYVRDYNPTKEYGGWGIRGTNNNAAVNVAGHEGLQIIFKNGKKLLIGTQKPEQIQKLINEYSRKHIVNT
ncbi:MAG TPA: hypothetical protein VN721_08355 [Flavipsychrobacter sp.]|nr:hypothetical protein [Flavipsychrobacter sp.]